ncbi:hypothetical protein [Prosthecobacter sp.]|uniref:hypothetical protein n=1 Tax=Prosthecobacter sp. TaxID=1965333 RepID=UPI002AB997C9|nr:hypothetical protein [Prosthecobacter sp.]MDZ4403820.1 hypothetical protein [Prosthecobacter sp.]
MNVPRSQFLVLGWLLFSNTDTFAQEAKKDAAPMPFPKLEHFAALWERSIFTTKDLPSPDAPAGPNFADNLSLSGIYEIDGGVVAVLVDRTTSQVMEARIGSENEMGIKIRKVTPGETVDKTRIQLQKGDQAGWVSFADPSASQPAEVIQRAVIPTQAPGKAASTAAAPNPILPQRRTLNTAPALPNNPLLPPPSMPIPTTPVNDVPLPPP